MRIRIIAGLALTGAAAAVAVAGGVAYATDAEHKAVVQIVTEQERAGNGGIGQQRSAEDCPDKSGAATNSPGPAESGQPAVPQEAL